MATALFSSLFHRQIIQQSMKMIALYSTNGGDSVTATCWPYEPSHWGKPVELQFCEDPVEVVDECCSLVVHLSGLTAGVHPWAFTNSPVNLDAEERVSLTVGSHCVLSYYFMKFFYLGPRSVLHNLKSLSFHQKLHRVQDLRNTFHSVK